MATRSWPTAAERDPVASRVGPGDDSAGIRDVIGQIGAAQDNADAVRLLRLATGHLGIDAAAFVSLLEDAPGVRSYRLLLACEPLWRVDDPNSGGFDDDPWLAHATRSTEPIRGQDVWAESQAQLSFVEAASNRGFRSSLIVPAPGPPGMPRVGVLYLGSDAPDHFNDEACALLRPLARDLAMELHEWWRRSLRTELLERSRLTDAELELLRHQAAGRCSKAIASAMNTEAKTIDCRFQRIIAKLEVPSRHEAARLAKVYGLI